MNRFLLPFALLLSICCLVISLLLWQEVHALRAQVSQHPLHTRLSNEQFAAVQGFVDETHKRFTEGTVPKGEVFLAEQLLAKARYMHGDISQEEWHRLNMQPEPGCTGLLIARVQAGAGTTSDLLNHFDDLLESSR